MSCILHFFFIYSVYTLSKTVREKCSFMKHKEQILIMHLFRRNK